MLALLILSACGSTNTPAVSNTASAPAAEVQGTLPVTRRYGDETVTPVGVTDGADTMDDAVLIVLFEKVYNNACVSNDWLLNVVIAYDEDDILPGSEGGTASAAQYAHVTGVDSMDTLKKYLGYCFSDNLLKTYIYPTYFECDIPKFIEQDGKLYENINTGGAIQQKPDYQASTVTEKSAASFTVNAPMHGPDNVVLEVYAYTVVQQNGYWVLDSFYFFDGDYFK